MKMKKWTQKMQNIRKPAPACHEILQSMHVSSERNVSRELVRLSLLGAIWTVSNNFNYYQ